MERSVKVFSIYLAITLILGLIGFSIYFSYNNSKSITGNIILNLNNQSKSLIVYSNSLNAAAATDLNQKFNPENDQLFNENTILNTPLLNQSDIISIGGPCENNFSKNLLGFPTLPTNLTECYINVSNNLSILPGQYLIKGMISPYNSSKIIVLLMGYQIAQTNDAASALKNMATISHTTLIYGPSLNNELQNCTSNWTEIRNTCNNTETLLVWYNDTNKCNNLTGIPVNKTSGCDYNHNGLIGSDSSPSYSNLDMQIYIGSNLINNSLSYNTTQTVEIKENGTTRVMFDYNFSTPLNLKEISIKKQPSSSQIGYLIVNGINASKTLIVDKLNSTAGAICVKKAEISAISSISNDCNESNEELVNCPGNHAGINCNISNNTFVVSGLTNSAVEEYSDVQAQNSCSANWNCSNWTICTSSQQTRICVDSKGCNTTTNKPTEVQSCVSCNVNWSCTNWKPTECPKNKTQTRLCLDTNNCKINTGKPEESQSCEYKSKNALVIVMIIIIILLICGLLVYFLYFNNKTGEDVIIQKPDLPPPTQTPYQNNSVIPPEQTNSNQQRFY